MTIHQIRVNPNTLSV